MPCYDPMQAAWDARVGADKTEAARILCNECREKLKAGQLATLPRRTIEWFLEHRKIDVENNSRFGIPNQMQPGRHGEYLAAKNDVERIEEILAQLPPE